MLQDARSKNMPVTSFALFQLAYQGDEAALPFFRTLKLPASRMTVPRPSAS